MGGSEDLHGNGAGSAEVADFLVGQDSSGHPGKQIAGVERPALVWAGVGPGSDGGAMQFAEMCGAVDEPAEIAARART